MIKVQNLVISRGARVLGRLPAFAAKAGEVIGVIGPSGCGKTTFLKSLAGSHPVNLDTSFLVDGEAVDSWQGVSVRTIQSFPLFHWLCAIEIVSLAATGTKGQFLPAGRALHAMGALRLHDRFPHQMSGGERARVTMAVAWSLRPRVLLLDEPFTGLDPVSKRELARDIFLRFGELGAVVFFVSHALEDIVTFSSRCLAFTRDGLREISPVTEASVLAAVS